MRARCPPGRFSYVLALVLTSAAVATRWLLDPWLGESLSFVTLFGAVAALVWYGGYRPAALASIFGYLACDYLFIAPRHSIGPDDLPEAFGMLAFFLSTAVIIGFGEAMRRAETALERREGELAELFDNASIALHWVDRDGIILKANKAELDLLGYRPEEYIGRNIATFHVDQAEIEDILARLARGETLRGYPARLQHKDGSIRDVLISSNVLVERGRFVHSRCFTIDVTDRKRGEEARTLLAGIVSASDDAIISKSLDGTIRSWNAGAERLFGYTEAEAVGRSISMIVPPELRDEELTILESMRRGERIDPFETVRVAKNGRRLDISLAVSPIRDESGEVVGASKIARDISDRKRAEQVLRTTEDRFARFMQHLPGLAWIKDLEGRYVFVNDAAEKAFRTSRSVLYGRRDEEVFPLEIATSFIENDRFALDSESGVQVIEVLEHEDGIHHSLVSKFPVMGSDGRPAWIGGMAIDITERMRAEEALREADRRKSEFLAMLSHELRNPLAPISNSLEIIKRGEQDPELMRQGLDIIDRQLRHLVRLVDDLLDVGRITHDRLQLQKARVDLCAVLQQTLETCRSAAESQTQAIDLLLPSEPVLLDADPDRLTQVFSNLLHNACKYTPADGTIRLAAERGDDEVLVSVEDSGIGIPSDKLDSIFELFSQAEATPERSGGGLGIGLTLVKRLVELHGGSIVARSGGPGMGSKFTVRLPIRLEDRHVEKPEAPAVFTPVEDPLRILVVDDNEDSAESLATLLKLGGHETRMAHDGLECLDVAGSFHPDVVLLDIGLPKLSGLEVCRRIRKQPWGRGVVMVALTGWGQDDDRQQTEGAGFDSHLVKPVDHQALTEVLGSASSRRKDLPA